MTTSANRLSSDSFVVDVAVTADTLAVVLDSKEPMSEPIQSVTAVSITSAAKAGISFGSALAITISWSANQSILWAIVHGFLSWIYVIYYALSVRT